MELVVGPSFSIETPSSSAAADTEKWVGSEESSLSSSSSSSSIGAPDDEDDNEEEGDEDVVSSKERVGVLASLDSLEDSLPIKRGLSNYFSGKSKSLANLSEVVGNVKEIEKIENPFNKRRRILLANKWASSSKKSSFYAWNNNPKSMPLLTLINENTQEEHEEEQDSSSLLTSIEKNKLQDPEEDKSVFNLRDGWDGILVPPTLEATRFKCQSCFSLTDLQ